MGRGWEFACATWTPSPGHCHAHAGGGSEDQHKADHVHVHTQIVSCMGSCSHASTYPMAVLCLCLSYCSFKSATGLPTLLCRCSDCRDMLGQFAGMDHSMLSQVGGGGGMKTHAHTVPCITIRTGALGGLIMGPLLLLSQLSAQFHAVMVLDDYALDFGVSGCLIDFGVSGCLVAALPLSCVQSRLFEGSSLGLSSLYGMCHFEGPPLPPSLSAKLATLLHRYCRLRQGFQPKPLSPPPQKNTIAPLPPVPSGVSA